MMMRAALPADIEHVVMNMGAEIAAHAFASLPHDDRVRFAADVGDFAERVTLGAFLCELEPVGLVGTVVLAPGRASIFFLNTDRFAAIGAEVHRWWHRHYVPGVLSQFRRVELTGSLPGTPTGRWYERLGFVSEGIARAYGKNGEDFGQWAWINPATVYGLPVPVGSLCHSTRQGAPHV